MSGSRQAAGRVESSCKRHGIGENATRNWQGL
jgi:hypothetical protein